MGANRWVSGIGVVVLLLCSTAVNAESDTRRVNWTGEPIKIEMNGWNLGKTTLALPPKDAGPGRHLLAAGNGQLVSNYVPFALDTLPE